MVRNISSLWPFAAAVCLAGCGLDNRDMGQQNSNRSAVAVSAFEEILHPVVVQNCGACHGSNQTPTFALPQARSAYEVIKGNALISGDDPAGSRLVVKGGQAHGGCPTCGASVADVIRGKIEEWAARVASAGEDDGDEPVIVENRTVVAAVAVPADLGTAFTPMTWDLGGGASLTMDIQRFGNSYRLRQPRLRAGSQGIEIKDVMFALNGQLDATATTFRNLDVIAGPGQFARISANTTVLPDPNGGTADMLALSFGLVRASAPRACKNPAGFVQEVRNRCQGCHNANHPLLAYTGDDAADCEKALMRVHRGSPGASVLILMPNQQLFGHPANTLNNADVGAVLSWINSELE